MSQYFELWLSKALAELVVGVGLLIVIALIVGVALLIEKYY